MCSVVPIMTKHDFITEKYYLELRNIYLFLFPSSIYPGQDARYNMLCRPFEIILSYLLKPNFISSPLL